MAISKKIPYAAIFCMLFIAHFSRGQGLPDGWLPGSVRLGTGERLEGNLLADMGANTVQVISPLYVRFFSAREVESFSVGAGDSARVFYALPFRPPGSQAGEVWFFELVAEGTVDFLARPVQLPGRGGQGVSLLTDPGDTGPLVGDEWYVAGHGGTLVACGTYWRDIAPRFGAHAEAVLGHVGARPPQRAARGDVRRAVAYHNGLTGFVPGR